MSKEKGIGGVLIIAMTILGATSRVIKAMKALHADFMLVRIEHEFLIQDYAERKDMRVEDLPTRSKAINIRG